MNYAKLALISLLSSMVCSCPIAVADDEVTTAHAKPGHNGKGIEDLPNLHEVHPFLYRSGEPTQAGLRKAKDMGIKTLIDLRAPSEQHFDEQKAANELGLKYVRLLMTSAAPTDEQVDTFINTVKQAQQDPAKGKVLVHCAHGSDRTGCMVGIWRVTQDNWDYDQAYKEMRKYWFTPKFLHLADAVKHHAKPSPEKASQASAADKNVKMSDTQ